MITKLHTLSLRSKKNRNKKIKIISFKAKMRIIYIKVKMRIIYVKARMGISRIKARRRAKAIITLK